jgi:signal transduction histidine kinase
LNKFGNRLTLDVSDNGTGIKEFEIESAKSLGILGMRERIVPFGGKLEIVGNPRSGTRVTVVIPHKKS